MDNTQKKIIFVPHCFLTKGFESGYRENMNDVLKILLDSDTGIVQMPCPHLFSIMNEEDTLSHCAEFVEKIKTNPEDLYAQILNPLLGRIVKYKQLNFEITGIIGVKNSPVCEVKSNKTSGKYGLFMKMLNQKLQEQSIQIPMVNIEAPINCSSSY